MTEEVPATPTKDENESYAKQQRFEGTIRVLTIDELVAIHQEDPSLIPGAKGARFAVLELDTPTQAKVFYPNAQKIRQTGISMILMAQDYPSDGGRVAAYESMDGTRATMLVSADKLIFPPDPRPPRAEPMAKEFELER
ncbi:hypothetical protein GCM10007338_12650 [Corynebacterium pelargi]|nr:hypothetical protein GCM10007338_12650 [Corynebacterium pelargi]